MNNSEKVYELSMRILSNEIPTKPLEFVNIDFEITKVYTNYRPSDYSYTHKSIGIFQFCYDKNYDIILSDSGCGGGVSPSLNKNYYVRVKDNDKKMKLIEYSFLRTEIIKFVLSKNNPSVH